jgi:hypothetical protein
MAVDYGVRRKGRRTALPLSAVAAAVTVTALIAGVAEHGAMAKKRALNIEAAREWTVSGPPCPAVTARQFVQRGLKAPQAFEYDDVVIGRQFGHVSCGALAYDGGRSLSSYPVCQFTGPGVLRVRTRKGEFFFEPGPGKPATISIPHGVPACVLASHFTL